MGQWEVGQWCIVYGAMLTLLEPLLIQQYNSLRTTAQSEGTLTNQAICNKHSTGSAAGRTSYMPSSGRLEQCTCQTVQYTGKRLYASQYPCNLAVREV